MLRCNSVVINYNKKFADSMEVFNVQRDEREQFMVELGEIKIELDKYTKKESEVGKMIECTRLKCDELSKQVVMLKQQKTEFMKNTIEKEI